MTTRPPEAWKGTLRRGMFMTIGLAIIASAALVVFGGGVTVVLRALAQVPLPLVALALFGVALEWAFDTARFIVAGRAVGVSLPWASWLEVALVNLFAAYVANIGPPVAAYVMARRGVPPGEALAVTIGKHLLFFPSALLPAWLLLWFSPNPVGGKALLGTLTVMVILSVVMLGSMVAVAIFPASAERLAQKVPFARRSKALSDFIAGISRFFRGRPSLLVASLVTALGNQAAIVLTVAALLQGFGGNALAPGVLGRCYLFTTLSQIAPTPGGAGISEAGGVLVFRALLPDASVAAHLVLCRFFTAGLPILAGGILLARALRRAPLTVGGPP